MTTFAQDNNRTDWTLATLSELLFSIGEARSRAEAFRMIVDAVAESLDAEIAAVIDAGFVTNSLGVRPHELTAGLRDFDLESKFGTLNVDGLGSCATLVVGVEGHSHLQLFVARQGSETFTGNEAALLNGMASAVGLVLSLLDRVEKERTLRNQTEAFLEITNAIARRAPHERIHHLIARHARTLLQCEVIVMRAFDPNSVEKQHPRVVCCEGLNSAQVAMLDVRVGLGVVAIGSEKVVSSYGAELSWISDIAPATTGAIAAPIFVGGVPLGSLGVLTEQPGRIFSNEEKNVLGSLAELASIVLTDEHTLQAVTNARHDLLTGLPGRGLILDRLTAELARSADSVTVFFIDLDEFKPINDRFGHEVGDAVLKVVSERMSSIFGIVGEVGRFGGDEFLAFARLGNTDHEESLADSLIEELRGRISVTVGPRVLDVGVGASVGIAKSHRNLTADELVRQSDAAMYQAKSTGKNRWRRFVDLSTAQAQ